MGFDGMPRLTGPPRSALAWIDGGAPDPTLGNWLRLAVRYAYGYMGCLILVGANALGEDGTRAGKTNVSGVLVAPAGQLLAVDEDFVELQALGVESEWAGGINPSPSFHLE